MNNRQRAVVLTIKRRLYQNQYTTDASLRLRAGEGTSDGSGLMWWAYQTALGMDIGKTIAAQLRRGTDVPMDTLDEARLQPGDLLYFYGMDGRVRHVEMYIGHGTLCGHGHGEGPYLHAMRPYCAYRQLRCCGLAALRRFLEVNV